MKTRWMGIVGLVLAMVAPPRAEAAGVSFKLTALLIDRGMLVCPEDVYCTPFDPTVPDDPDTPLADRHLCAGTSLASAAPAYECRVNVGATFSGTAPRDVSVRLTFSVTSDDGNPWGDDVRRTLRAQPNLTKPPADGAPSPCSAIPAADPRISCARTGARTWTVTKTTSTKTGLYSVPALISFPASTGTEPTCEYLRIRGTAKAGSLTASVDLGRKRYCA